MWVGNGGYTDPNNTDYSSAVHLDAAGRVGALVERVADAVAVLVERAAPPVHGAALRCSGAAIDSVVDAVPIGILRLRAASNC